ncbi:MAG: insulinase family protein [Salinivirgaceae bacterium]|nr:insulinase family protein [Salinivirgaceae bacterium]
MNLNRTKAPDFHRIDNINIPKTEFGLLSNKIPFHVLSGGSQELSYIALTFNAGTITSNQLLVASITNAMLIGGTKKHSASQIADTFDFYGAEIRTDSNFDHAVIALFCLNKYLEHLLPLFCELITESAFPDSELESVIAEKKHKLIVNKEKTGFLANGAMHKLTFGSHPYARRAEPADYDKITRNTLVGFHSSQYHAGNCHLLAIGCITDAVMSLIDKTIGNLPVKEKTEIQFATLAPTAKNATEIIKKKNAVQSSLRMGMQTIRMNHPDYHKLNILTTILGGYFGSRLMKNIREEKGYTYGIYSVMQPYLQSGLLRIAGEIKSGYAMQVADEVRREMQNLKDKLVSDSELELVRNYMMGEMLQTFDGPLSSIDAVEKAIDMEVGIDFYDKEQQEIMSIKPIDIQEIANKYFDLDKLTVAIAGNE